MADNNYALPTINQLVDLIGEGEAKELLSYNARRKEINRWIAEQPHGTQAKVASDCGYSQPLLSSVLSGTYHRVDVLDKVAAWIASAGG